MQFIDKKTEAVIWWIIVLWTYTYLVYVRIIYIVRTKRERERETHVMLDVVICRYLVWSRAPHRCIYVGAAGIVETLARLVVDIKRRACERTMQAGITSLLHTGFADTHHTLLTTSCAHARHTRIILGGAHTSHLIIPRETFYSEAQFKSQIYPSSNNVMTT